MKAYHAIRNPTPHTDSGSAASRKHGASKKNSPGKESTDSQTGIQIEGYAVGDPPDYLKQQSSGVEALGTLTPSLLNQNAMNQAQVALRVFEHYFGKTPFERLAVTQQPEFDFGQS